MYHKPKTFDSAQWLFSQDAFQEWQSLGVSDAQVASPTFLTIKGKAFTGKSVLMRMAVEASLQNKKVITLRHFFGGISSDPIVELLRDLLHQLLWAIPNEQKPWKDIDRWSKEIQDNQCAELSSSDRLKEAITRILVQGKDSLAVRIFIDAIDDCLGDHSGNMISDSAESGNTSVEVVKILMGILKPSLEARADVGICISRRHLPEYYVGESPSTTINLEEYMNQMIGPFIRQQLESIPDSKKTIELLFELSRSGAHNFHWANLTCEALVKKSCNSLEDLKRLASEVVENHETLYCRALRHSWHKYPTHRPLLQIALSTFRQLTPKELRHAFAFSSGEFDFGNMASWEKSAKGYTEASFREFLSDGTGGLLEIVTWKKRSRWAMNEQEAAESEESQHHVCFLHRSTETFLRSDRGLKELQAESRSHFEKHCHFLLAQICGMALQKCLFMGNDDVDILHYACEFWVRHAQLCGELGHDLQLPIFMEHCSSARCQRFIQQKVKLIQESMSPASIPLEDETSMMVLLSAQGCTNLLSKHADTCKVCTRAVPRPSSKKRPSDIFLKSLSIAIMEGHFVTASYLLKLLPPQHIDVLLGRGMTILYRACYSHCNATSKETKTEGLVFIHKLLSSDANPCEGYFGGAYEYPLHLAIATDNRSLIEALCRGGDPGRLRDGGFTQLRAQFELGDHKLQWPALHYAVKCNSGSRDARTRADTLAVLLREAPRGVGLLRQHDKDGKTALQLAEDMDDTIIAEVLRDFADLHDWTEDDEDSEDDEEDEDSEDDEEEEDSENEEHGDEEASEQGDLSNI